MAYLYESDVHSVHFCQQCCPRISLSCVGVVRVSRACKLKRGLASFQKDGLTIWNIRLGFLKTLHQTRCVVICSFWKNWLEYFRECNISCSNTCLKQKVSLVVWISGSGKIWIFKWEKGIALICNLMLLRQDVICSEAGVHLPEKSYSFQTKGILLLYFLFKNMSYHGFSNSVLSFSVIRKDK